MCECLSMILIMPFALLFGPIIVIYMTIYERCLEEIENMAKFVICCIFSLIISISAGIVLGAICFTIFLIPAYIYVIFRLLRNICRRCKNT